MFFDALKNRYTKNTKTEQRQYTIVRDRTFITDIFYDRGWVGGNCFRRFGMGGRRGGTF